MDHLVLSKLIMDQDEEACTLAMLANEADARCEYTEADRLRAYSARATNNARILHNVYVRMEDSGAD